jgi:outer membrane receptor protein involved in Fe transport
MVAFKIMQETFSIRIYQVSHRGTWIAGKHTVAWGVDYKHERLNDKINEWDRLDSAGYSLHYFDDQKSFYGDSMAPSANPTISMDNVLKGTFTLNSNRFTAYIQDTWRLGKEERVTFNYGVRFQYWDVNKEPMCYTACSVFVPSEDKEKCRCNLYLIRWNVLPTSVLS